MKNFRLKDKYRFGFPKKRGLYDPQFEKDSCGVGLVANIKGIPSREIMDDAFHVNSQMDHRRWMWVRRKHRRWSWNTYGIAR